MAHKAKQIISPAVTINDHNNKNIMNTTNTLSPTRTKDVTPAASCEVTGLSLKISCLRLPDCSHHLKHESDSLNRPLWWKILQF